MIGQRPPTPAGLEYARQDAHVHVDGAVSDAGLVARLLESRIVAAIHGAPLSAGRPVVNGAVGCPAVCAGGIRRDERWTFDRAFARIMSDVRLACVRHEEDVGPRRATWRSRGRRFAKAATSHRTGLKLTISGPFLSGLGWRWLPDDRFRTSLGHTSGHTPDDVNVVCIVSSRDRSGWSGSGDGAGYRPAGDRAPSFGSRVGTQTSVPPRRRRSLLPRRYHVGLAALTTR